MPDGSAYLKEIGFNLDELVFKQSSEAELVDFINGINAAQLLTACLAVAKRSNTLLGDLCKSSYQHPNGFVKITLIDRLPSWALRLHIWHVPVQQTKNDLHDHCGYLVSRILRGNLINDVYERCEEGRGVPYFSYADQLDASQHTLTYIGMSSLILVRREIFRSPVSYFLGGEVIHRTTPAAAFPVISMVVQGPKYKTTSLIYRFSQRRSAEVVSTICSDALYFDSLKEALRYC